MKRIPKTKRKPDVPAIYNCSPTQLKRLCFAHKTQALAAFCIDHSMRLPAEGTVKL